MDRRSYIYVIIIYYEFNAIEQPYFSAFTLSLAIWIEYWPLKGHYSMNMLDDKVTAESSLFEYFLSRKRESTQ